MDFLRSLILIPDNPRYLKGLEDIDEFTSPEDILKRKIKENPYNRDLLKRKVKNQQRYITPPPRLSVRSNKFSNNRTVSENPIVDNGEKNYIKNLTGSLIIILTDEISESGRNKGYPKAIQIKEFIDKNEISQKELNNPQLLALYEQGKIVDITQTEYREGMKGVWKERDRTQRIKEAAVDQNIFDLDNPSRNKSSGGISRVAERGDPESIADKVASGELYGELYGEEAEHTINLSGAERGPSLERELGMIESAAADDHPIDEGELRDLMRNF